MTQLWANDAWHWKKQFVDDGIMFRVERNVYYLACWLSQTELD